MATTADAPNAQYNLMAPRSLAARVAARARRRMYERFLASTAIAPCETLLDVGATSDESYDASNYVESWYPHKDKITAVGIDDASGLQRRYPGLRFTRADGRDLPFADGAFDVTHSSAVLEHVGGEDQQRRLIGELVRVARRAAFFTTPNRWFPLEFHTQLPLLHWLPKPVFRDLLGKSARYRFFSLEENLNLVGRGDVRRLCAGLNGCTVEIESLRLLAWPSNLLVTIHKNVAS